MSEPWGTRIEDWDPKYFADAMHDYFCSGKYRVPFADKLINKQEKRIMSDKTGRIDFLRAKHTEHLRLADSLYREDELSQTSDVIEELGVAAFFYAVEDEAIGSLGCVTAYAYHGVFYDIDSTLNIDMTSMRFHTIISIYHDTWHNEKIENAIDTLITDDTEYRMRRDSIH